MTIFDSRDTKYKSPFGAVSCGTTVSFTVTPGPEYCACALVTYGEFAVIRGETALSPCPEGFTGTFTVPDTPEWISEETKPPALPTTVPTYTWSPLATAGAAGAPMCCAMDSTIRLGTGIFTVSQSDVLFSCGT